jgi:hypothetical protein
VKTSHEYRFENEGWGSLELEILETNRNSFPVDDLDKVSFTSKGFGKSKLECNGYFGAC